MRVAALAAMLALAGIGANAAPPQVAFKSAKRKGE